MPAPEHSDQAVPARLPAGSIRFCSDGDDWATLVFAGQPVMWLMRDGDSDAWWLHDTLPDQDPDLIGPLERAVARAHERIAAAAAIHQARHIPADDRRLRLVCTCGSWVSAPFSATAPAARRRAEARHTAHADAAAPQTRLPT